MSKTLVMQDAREYVFPILSVAANTEANSVEMKTGQYLGTGFFVTKRGDAVTAGHIVPREHDPQRRLVAVVMVGGRETICWINMSAVFFQFDLALVNVNLKQTRFIPVADKFVPSGSDVMMLGIPDHSISGTGKEMRILKGHVTLTTTRLELSIPVPRGMSGSPVFLGTSVVGWATGIARSEELEESIEEEIVQRKDGEKMTKRTEIKRMIHYGIAHPFEMLKGKKYPALNDRTLMEFIHQQNKKA